MADEQPGHAAAVELEPLGSTWIQSYSRAFGCYLRKFHGFGSTEQACHLALAAALSSYVSCSGDSPPRQKVLSMMDEDMVTALAFWSVDVGLQSSATANLTDPR